MKLILSLLALAAFNPLASAFTLEEDYAALKDSGQSLVVTGEVCEQVAILELARTYPEPQYHIVNGIAYGDDQRTIGELDAVVFDAASNSVIKIGEVKCWNDLNAVLHKAQDQRARFLKNVRSAHLHFQSTHDNRVYSQAQFAGVQDFETIGPAGAKAYGFDIELDHSLNELMGLRTRIMDCQNRGECRRPL